MRDMDARRGNPRPRLAQAWLAAPPKHLQLCLDIVTFHQLVVQVLPLLTFIIRRQTCLARMVDRPPPSHDL